MFESVYNWLRKHQFIAAAYYALAVPALSGEQKAVGLEQRLHHTQQRLHHTTKTIPQEEVCATDVLSEP